MSEGTAALRADARAIYDAAVDAVEPAKAVRAALERRPLEGDPYVVAIGKAASAMAGAARDRGARRGLIVTNMANARPRAGFRVLVGDHPEPGSGSIAGGDAVEQAFQEHEELLVLVSGGASAMVCAPALGLELHDIVNATQLLMRRGADIEELNTVRRHLSRIKGGQALQEGQGVRALLLSDVLGNAPEAIGSGIAAPDPTTYRDALRVLERHGLLGAVTQAVRNHLELGDAGAFPDTPDARDPRIAGLDMTIVAGIDQAIEGARACAEALGYRVILLSPYLEGEARDAARWIADQAAPQGRIALIAGGETTVTITGRGRGGRSQELALAFAQLRRAEPSGRPWALLSAGTDGRDGPTDAAGAIIDAERVTGLDAIDQALADNNSHPALDAVGALIRTGPSGTNVGDIVTLLYGE
uniref:Putative glycerate kinase n=1 Tax=uncultured bacterium HF186_25m_13D19 TaxID=662888 RepID=C7FPG5_9BACT|nr:putative glycerate kinase [uncultured bacterium HF186_25m_13D19]